MPDAVEQPAPVSTSRRGCRRTKASSASASVARSTAVLMRDQCKRTAFRLRARRTGRAARGSRAPESPSARSNGRSKRLPARSSSADSIRTAYAPERQGASGRNVQTVSLASTADVPGTRAPSASSTRRKRCSSARSSGSGRRTVSVPSAAGAATSTASTRGGSRSAGPARNACVERRAHRRPLRVRHGRVDHEPVRAAVDERRAQALAGSDAALDASGMEEQREPRAPGVPQALVDLDERERHLAPGVVLEAHVARGVARRHRPRELDVRAQRVRGQHVGGGVERDDVRRIARSRRLRGERAQETLAGDARPRDVRHVGGEAEQRAEVQALVVERSTSPRRRVPPGAPGSCGPRARADARRRPRRCAASPRRARSG